MINLRAVYDRYISACNDSDWSTVSDCIHPRLTVNDQSLSAEEYIGNIRRVRESFPDYHWEILTFLQEHDSIAVLLRDTGTHTGSAWLGFPARHHPVSTFELAMYRFEGGRIIEIWSAADTEKVRQMIRR